MIQGSNWYIIVFWELFQSKVIQEFVKIQIFHRKKIIFCKNLKNFIIFKSNWSNVNGDKFPFTVFLPKMCRKLRIQIFLFSCPCMNQKTAILDFEKFVLSLHSTGQNLSSRDKHSLDKTRRSDFVKSESKNEVAMWWIIRKYV